MIAVGSVICDYRRFMGGMDILMVLEIAFGFAGVICWAAAAFMTFLHIRSVKQAESEQEPSKPQAAAPDV